MVRPLYTVRNSKRVLDGIQLTMEGKRVLGRIEANQDKISQPVNNGSPSITDVMKIVARLRKENEDYEITFDVKLKNT